MTRSNTPTRTMTSILVEGGIVTEAQVEQAVSHQRERGILIGEALVDLGFTSEENIVWALSKQLGIPYVDVRADAIDLDQVKRLPEALLRRVQAVPLFGTQSEVTVAMADPTDQDAAQELRSASGASLSIVIGAPGSIRRALDRVYGVWSGGGPAKDPGVAGEPAAARHDVVWDRAGTSFLLFHLHAARHQEASEIHFLEGEGGLKVFYRTDRGLESQATERSEAALYLRARLGVLGVADLEQTSEYFSEGSVVIGVGADRMVARVSHCRTSSGVGTVLCLAPRLDAAPDLATVGLSPIAEAEIREMAEGPEGLVIVHGPPRAGGSTLLAALAAAADSPARRTLVLEPSASAPYPESATRVLFTDRDDAARRWQRVVIGQGVDVAILDDVLQGEAIAGVLSGASAGRLVFARTDWLDGKALLSFLASRRNGRLVLSDRPFALLGLPTGRWNGSSVWKAPEERVGAIGATILTDADRDAMLRRGAR